MDLECETCGKVFNTNAGLYTHQQKMHNAPSVVLVDHNRHGGDHWRPTERKREPYDDITDPRPRKLKYKHPSIRKRKPSKRKPEPESEFDKFVYPPKKRRDGEDDTGLEVIDEYNDDSDAELDDDMEIIDDLPPLPDVSTDDDEDLPSPSDPIQPPISPSQINYKKLYEKCRRNNNKIKSRCKKQLKMLDGKHKAILKQRLDALNDKRDADIVDMRERFRKQLKDLEEAKNDRIVDIQNGHRTTIDRMTVDHQDIVAELETECENKIKVLKTHIKDLQDEGEEFTNLSKAIFNCTTIEEIFEIERLVKNHRLDEVAQKHLKTLQNLFLSLSYGILPICDMQRKMVTSKQRELVEKIQTSSGPTARRHLIEGRNEVINLFTIINDSLKLIKNTFNRYGTLPDA